MYVNRVRIIRKKIGALRGWVRRQVIYNFERQSLARLDRQSRRWNCPLEGRSVDQPAISRELVRQRIVRNTGVKRRLKDAAGRLAHLWLGEARRRWGNVSARAAASGQDQGKSNQSSK